MLSKSAEVVKDYAYIKDMRESGTPLTIGSLALDFHKSGWFINLNATGTTASICHTHQAIATSLL